MPADAVPVPEAGSAGRPRTILVMDDESSTVKLILAALGKRYRVHGAFGLAEGRDVLRQFVPDLLILDVRLGEEDGLEFLSEFRQKSSVPVLLITGFGSEAVAARALELRANGYLRKPFDLNELRVKVDGLLAEGPRAEHLAERARAVIDRIATESVTVLELAERMGVKPAHLQGAFRDRYGKTPMQYLRAVRLQQAQALLLTTKIPVSEVAVMVGFREITYFDRSFKRQYGVTPLEYRRTRALPESR